MSEHHSAAGETLTDDALGEHLVASRLAGSVATSVRSCLENCHRVMAGDPDTTFGLSDWQSATLSEVVDSLRAGGVVLPSADTPPEEAHGTAYIEPDAALEGIRRHRDGLADLARGRARVLIATGHPFALLSHYGALARALEGAGCTIVRPLEGEHHDLRTPEGVACSIRYLDGVGTLAYHGALHHTHRPDYMEAMLEAAGGNGGVDAVVADHGFAGAAVETGIPTLSIADANDPGLPLAQLRGRTDGVLILDDGLEPAQYEPVTAAMLAWTA